MSGKPSRPTVRDALLKNSQALQPKRIVCEADRHLGRLEAEILLGHVLKKDRAWLLAHSENRVQVTGYRLFQKLLSRRLKHEPIAYILGEKEFYGLPIRVNRHVLVPRPESELLVDLALQRLGETPHTVSLVWDVGTGSGAIALAIANRLQTFHVPHVTFHVLASDISAPALSLAKTNAKRLNIKNITFLKANLLDSSARRFLDQHSSFYIRHSSLIITANLPYLPASDHPRLDPDVAKYEPLGALFGGTDGLAVIEKFLRQLSAFDISFKALLLEYDPRQTKKLRALVKTLFPHFKTRVHKDLARRDRVMEIRPAP